MLNVFGKFSLSEFHAKVSTKSDARRVGKEHFIPVRPSELIQQLLTSDALSSEQKLRFPALCRQLDTFFHNEIRQEVQRLNELYALVSPDRDTERFEDIDEYQRETAIASLFDGIAVLLERANFQRLTQQQLEHAIGNASELGVRLNVDLTAFQRLAVYARGESSVRHRRRIWRRGLKTIESNIPMYQRLVVVFRLNASEADDETVTAAYLKLFKNVPKQDVDMTLPGARVRMSWFDQGKILLPTLSGIGITVLKIFKGALLLAFASFYGLLAAIGLIGGAIGSGLKSLHGYVRTKNKYELSLARNLYYQNLDNNAGVLLRLASEAEAQEIREAILAYFVLMTNGAPCDEGQLQAKAEALLRDYGITIDFESKDAIRKLERLGICQRVEGELLQDESLEAAIRAVTGENLKAAAI